MKVSVVITSYNQEIYLSDAIESVLSQTVSPYEIIICDDFSTKDNTRGIVKGYHTRYPDLIKPIFQPRNIGIAANRNAGFRATSGEYVTWLDGDDRFLPEKIEKELEVLKKNPRADIAYSNVYYTDEKLARLKMRYKTGEGLNGNLFEGIATRELHPPLMMMVHRICLDEIGYMDESLPIYEDWEWKIRLASKFLFAYCPEPLYEYRMHSEGVHNLSRSGHVPIMTNIVRRAIALCDAGVIPHHKEIKRKIEFYLATLLTENMFISGEKAELSTFISDRLNISEKKAMLLVRSLHIEKKITSKISPFKRSRLLTMLMSLARNGGFLKKT